MHESDQPLISVLIVNWRSGAMSVGLVRDLARQRLPGRAPGAGFQVVVVDNASGAAEEPFLAELEGLGAVVVRSQQNSGYAAGMNLACERATGRYVLVCNPDVLFFRGMVGRLLEHLEKHPRCGLVGPKAYLDSQRFFQLPPNELPTLCDLASETLARALPGHGRRHAAARTRRAVAQWTATAPVAVSQISGFCFLMARELARTLGPFDTAYPFYFEDSDLCLRLQRKGFTTDLCPQAEMVHFFNKSAGQDQQAAMSRYEVSRRLFFRRRYGAVGQALANMLLGITAGRHGKGHEFAEVDDLGPCESVPVLEVPGHGAYVAEIAVDPGFVFAAGRLDVARRFRIPDDVWHGLVEASYYVRFVDRRFWTVLRTVRVTKVGAPVPVTAQSAAASLVHA